MFRAIRNRASMFHDDSSIPAQGDVGMECMSGSGLADLVAMLTVLSYT